MSDGAIASPATRVARVGAHKVEGRAKGAWVTVVQPERVTLNMGIDSEGMFVDNGDQSADITFNLLPSSNSNDVFNAVMQANLPVPIVIEDLNGRTVGGCARAMCVKKADVSWSDGADVVAWTFRATTWKWVLGGSDPSPTNTDV